MNKPNRIVTDEVAAQIIEAYQRGDKVRDIEQRHGIARATLYWVLDRAEVTPDRAKKSIRQSGDLATMSHLYRIIESQEVYITELEEQIRKLGGEPGVISPRPDRNGH
jgi:transposase-like protein